MDVFADVAMVMSTLGWEASQLSAVAMKAAPPVFPKRAEPDAIITWACLVLGEGR